MEYKNNTVINVKTRVLCTSKLSCLKYVSQGNHMYTRYIKTHPLYINIPLSRRTFVVQIIRVGSQPIRTKYVADVSHIRTRCTFTLTCISHVSQSNHAYLAHKNNHGLYTRNNTHKCDKERTVPRVRCTRHGKLTNVW